MRIHVPCGFFCAHTIGRYVIVQRTTLKTKNRQYIALWYSKRMKMRNIDTDLTKITDILERDTEDIFVKESLIERLQSGKQLRVKLGVDPTSAHIHIGRANVLRKLRAFQDLGHTPVFIVGDFTAQIGDPSDKLSKRPMLTAEQIQENLRTYKEQVGKIIDLDTAEFHYNSTWLSKLDFKEIANLAESFSVQQMLARRNFSERYEKGEEISLREFLYPLMQGYDSVEVRADIEIGGFDQLFNIKAGRIIQKYYGMREQDVLTIKMLVGTDGRKMSSSWGNIISITASPNDMYGKVMSLSDDVIETYFKQATNVSLQEISELMKQIEQGENPKHIKMRLAREIVKIYHSEKDAELAEAQFNAVFSLKQAPTDAAIINAPIGSLIADCLLDHGYIASKAEWKRLVIGGGVRLAEGDVPIDDQFAKITAPLFLKIGKKKFVRIELSK